MENSRKREPLPESFCARWKEAVEILYNAKLRQEFGEDCPYVAVATVTMKK